jgi:hypothetical protein
MRSPQARLNARHLRAARLARGRIIGSWICALTVAAGTLMLAHMALGLALHLPDLIARGAAGARW